MRVLIVDDEPLARRGVRLRLQRFQEVEVVGECGDGACAIERILELAPDLVFLDVQMPGLDGFDVLRALPRERLPFIIFLTAYEQHALRAFEVHALDYLLKPIDDERFSAAMERAILAGEAGSRLQRAEGILRVLQRDGARYPSRFPVRIGSRIQIVLTEDLEWIAASGDYVELHAGGKCHLLRETFKGMEDQLDPEQFIRIHRSRMLRTRCIRELRSLDNREYLVTLADGTEHRSSRTFADRLEQWLTSARS